MVFWHGEPSRLGPNDTSICRTLPGHQGIEIALWDRLHAFKARGPVHGKHCRFLPLHSIVTFFFFLVQGKIFPVKTGICWSKGSSGYSGVDSPHHPSRFSSGFIPYSLKHLQYNSLRIVRVPSIPIRNTAQFGMNESGCAAVVLFSFILPSLSRDVFSSHTLWVVWVFVVPHILIFVLFFW